MDRPEWMDGSPMNHPVPTEANRERKGKEEDRGWDGRVASIQARRADVLEIVVKVSIENHRVHPRGWMA